MWLHWVIIRANNIEEYWKRGYTSEYGQTSYNESKPPFVLRILCTNEQCTPTADDFTKEGSMTNATASSILRCRIPIQKNSIRLGIEQVESNQLQLL